MFRSWSLLILLVLSYNCFAQNNIYKDSLNAYQQNYVNTHEVVLGNDRQCLHFYDINQHYCVRATFQKTFDAIGFDMITSSGKKRLYYKYGMLTFKLGDSTLHLFVYQSDALMKTEKYKDFLFIPFGDATTGIDSYGGGRYIDIAIQDIKDNKVLLDFNKAYNPYCAYTAGYNCPLPPMENLLKIAIRAGERNYGKAIH
jgi:uncharacterized protein